MTQQRTKYEGVKTHFENLRDVVSDQAKGIKAPLLEKPYEKDAELIDLPKADKELVKVSNLFDCLDRRRSRRNLLESALSLDELAYLLWFTQGNKRVFKRSEDFSVALKTVPSAGARHPFETYLFVNNVEGLEKGLYRYLPLTHQLTLIGQHNCTIPNLTDATMGQEFVAKAPVVFIWAALPYRTGWRYATEAEKLVLLDAGHVCQNLYIAAESLKLGTCAIAAYSQTMIDEILNLDGDEECVVYLAPVGRYQD